MRNRDIYKLSDYLNIVNTLIEKHSFDSLFKVTITALVLYYQTNSDMELRKVSQNIFQGFFKNFHSVVLSNYSDFYVISQALLINEKNGNITVNEDEIVKKRRLETVKNKYLEKENIVEILCDIKNMSIKSFAQEVVENV